MPRHFNRGRGGFGRGMRQRTSWQRTVPAAAVAVGPQTSVLINTFGAEAIAEEGTVRRTLLALRVTSDQTASEELQIGAVGMHIANDQAVAAGAGSLLRPVTDADDEAWFLWSPINQRNNAAAIDTDSGHLYMIDSKAQRKVELGQSIVTLIENSHAVHTFNVVAMISMLVGFGMKRG